MRKTLQKQNGRNVMDYYYVDDMELQITKLFLVLHCPQYTKTKIIFQNIYFIWS